MAADKPTVEEMAAAIAMLERLKSSATRTFYSGGWHESATVHSCEWLLATIARDAALRARLAEIAEEWRAAVSAYQDGGRSLVEAGLIVKCADELKAELARNPADESRLAKARAVVEKEMKGDS